MVALDVAVTAAVLALSWVSPAAATPMGLMRGGWGYGTGRRTSVGGGMAQYGSRGTGGWAAYGGTPRRGGAQSRYETTDARRDASSPRRNGQFGIRTGESAASRGRPRTTTPNNRGLGRELAGKTSLQLGDRKHKKKNKAKQNNRAGQPSHHVTVTTQNRKGHDRVLINKPGVQFGDKNRVSDTKTNTKKTNTILTNGVVQASQQPTTATSTGPNRKGRDRVLVQRPGVQLGDKKRIKKVKGKKKNNDGKTSQPLTKRPGRASHSPERQQQQQQPHSSDSGLGTSDGGRGSSTQRQQHRPLFDKPLEATRSKQRNKSPKTKKADQTSRSSGDQVLSRNRGLDPHEQVHPIDMLNRIREMSKDKQKGVKPSQTPESAQQPQVDGLHQQRQQQQAHSNSGGDLLKSPATNDMEQPAYTSTKHRQQVHREQQQQPQQSNANDVGTGFPPPRPVQPKPVIRPHARPANNNNANQVAGQSEVPPVPGPKPKGLLTSSSNPSSSDERQAQHSRQRDKTPPRPPPLPLGPKPIGSLTSSSNPSSANKGQAQRSRQREATQSSFRPKPAGSLTSSSDLSSADEGQAPRSRQREMTQPLFGPKPAGSLTSSSDLSSADEGQAHRPERDSNHHHGSSSRTGNRPRQFRQQTYRTEPDGVNPWVDRNGRLRRPNSLPGVDPPRRRPESEHLAYLEPGPDGTMHAYDHAGTNPFHFPIGFVPHSQREATSAPSRPRSRAFGSYNDFISQRSGAESSSDSDSRWSSRRTLEQKTPVPQQGNNFNVMRQNRRANAARAWEPSEPHDNRRQRNGYQSSGSDTQSDPPPSYDNHHRDQKIASKRPRPESPPPDYSGNAQPRWHQAIIEAPRQNSPPPRYSSHETHTPFDFPWQTPQSPRYRSSTPPRRNQSPSRAHYSDNYNDLYFPLAPPQVYQTLSRGTHVPRPATTFRQGTPQRPTAPPSGFSLFKDRFKQTLGKLNPKKFFRSKSRSSGALTDLEAYPGDASYNSYQRQMMNSPQSRRRSSLFRNPVSDYMYAFTPGRDVLAAQRGYSRVPTRQPPRYFSQGQGHVQGSSAVQSEDDQPGRWRAPSRSGASPGSQRGYSSAPSRYDTNPTHAQSSSDFTSSETESDAPHAPVLGGSSSQRGGYNPVSLPTYAASEDESSGFTSGASSIRGSNRGSTPYSSRGGYASGSGASGVDTGYGTNSDAPSEPETPVHRANMPVSQTDVRGHGRPARGRPRLPELAK